MARLDRTSRVNKQHIDKNQRTLRQLTGVDPSDEPAEEILDVSAVVSGLMNSSNSEHIL